MDRNYPPKFTNPFQNGRRGIFLGRYVDIFLENKIQFNLNDRIEKIWKLTMNYECFIYLLA